MQICTLKEAFYNTVCSQNVVRWLPWCALSPAHSRENDTIQQIDFSSRLVKYWTKESVLDLHCEHIVVLGHTGCGAVAAALAGGGEGFIRYITDDILEAIGEEKDPDKACRLNVAHAVKRLKREFTVHPEIKSVRIGL